MPQAFNDETVTGPLQQTIAKPVSFAGVAVHSGAQIALTICPSQPGTGIRFVRTDIADKDNVIPALWDHVVDTHMCTAIANTAGVRVATIEHLMAALYACEIDNARIEISGPEVPIADGSSAPFVELIEAVGIQQQKAPRGFIEVLKPVEVKIDARRFVKLSPADSFSVAATHDFKDMADLHAQTYYFDGTSAAFKDQIMRARTFGFMQQVEHLWSSGLAKGGSLDNAVVIDGSRVLNKEGFRYPDECVRHKILDAVGDLYLAGAPILGHYEGSQCGHALNNQLLRTLFTDRSAWRLTDSVVEQCFPDSLLFYAPAKEALVAQG